MPEHINLICPKCGKQCDCVYIAGFHSAILEKGTTGHSHLVRRGKSEKIIGDCECGYKFKIKDAGEF